MSRPRESIDPGRSEFEEDYDRDLATSDVDRPDTFSAELLERAVQTLAKGKTPVCVPATMLLSKAIEGMAERNQGAVLVTDDGGQLVGIFTERDVIRRVIGRLDPDKTPVAEVMTREPEAVMFFNNIGFALNKMTVGGFRHVPIVDTDKKPVGILSMKDVVHYFAEHFPQHVLNVPPDPLVLQPDQNAGTG